MQVAGETDLKEKSISQFDLAVDGEFNESRRSGLVRRLSATSARETGLVKASGRTQT
jgi:hypothetical protein